MNRRIQLLRGKSMVGRFNRGHVKRAAQSSDTDSDSAEISQLRNCLSTNGSGPACLEANTRVPFRAAARNNASNIENLTSASPDSNTSTTIPPKHKSVSSSAERLGWKIGLIVPLVVILLAIGLAARHNLLKRRRARQTRQRTSIPAGLGGEKTQQAENEKPNKYAGSHPKGDVEDSLQVQEILKSPVKAKTTYCSPVEVLASETVAAKNLTDEPDPPSGKLSNTTRFSLRSLSLRPALDMSIFQARNNAPVDTFQLEMKNRERMSQSK
ncbi:hypothetical protein VP01_680g11 [Puccinia sorghi]|uniref:Uncharacterized protein n=1 Tax=Puccinia sorghi TaxID=27349 RepID=A0A0L6UGN9_9BASI|nr:hypothetical protein VP01_680g11 [Puccinia sorghi]